MSALVVEDWGEIEYEQAWNRQKQLFALSIAEKNAGNSAKNTLIFCTHKHVYTFGKSAEQANLLVDKSFLQNAGASIFEIERGGDITYHGPGQWVVYPILDLEQFGLGIKKYVECLELCIIHTLLEFGIIASIVQGRTGVWIDEGKKNERKIAAIGIKSSKYVTMHGLALNVNTDLSMFGNIVPCGIPDKEVTSMEKELGEKIDMLSVKKSLEQNFLNIFENKLLTKTNNK